MGGLGRFFLSLGNNIYNLTQVLNHKINYMDDSHCSSLYRSISSPSGVCRNL